VPFTALVPAQEVGPVAVQDVALDELHIRLAAPPLTTAPGTAEKLTVGTGFAVTVTVAVTAGLVPPGPVQVSENVVVAVRAPVL
jgi:hypothetical protein